MSSRLAAALLVIWTLASGVARAASPTGHIDATVETPGEAISQCNTWFAAQQATYPGTYGQEPYPTCATHAPIAPVNEGSGGYVVIQTWPSAYAATWKYTTGCASGEEMDATTGACSNPNEECQALADGGSDPESNAYNPEDSVVSRPSATECVGGCTFAADPGTVSTSFGGSVVAVSGHFRFTGTTCSATPESPAPALEAPKAVDLPPVCVAAGSGQTFCKAQDGKNCYTASTGRQICWSDGETGTKTDGPVAQKREPGSDVIAAPTAPPGETLAQQGTPTTVTHTSSTTTTTTTTTNYVTQYGTNAGPSNQGSPAGSPTGNGDSDVGGETGTVSGDGSCESQYVITGGDPVANHILLEAHKENCEAKKRYEYQGNGLADVIAAGDGTTGVTAASAWKGDGPPGSEPTLDTSGMGASGTCPTLPTLGDLGAIDQDKFCDLGWILGWLFLALALGWGYQVIFS